VENAAGKEGHYFGKKLELFFLLVSGEERFGGLTHVPVDLCQFLFIKGLRVG
jgi:hypothetical protein